MSASACALPVLGAPFGDGPSFNLTFGELVASPSGDIDGAAAENTGLLALTVGLPGGESPPRVP